jgi:hypothetical protein
MPEFDKPGYKFPDEMDDNQVNITIEHDDDKIEIEIEDDTPPEDRNRDPMPREIVEKLDKEELENYSNDVREKFKQAKKVYHDERREKEAALRERQEAVEAAKNLYEENKRIKSMLSSGEKEYVAAVKNSTEMQLEMAKKAYREAYDMGDIDKQIEAQELITKATMQLEKVNNFKLPPLQEEKFEVQPQQQVQVPRPDERVMRWQQQNPWFGQDEEMTASALGLHEKLKRTGIRLGSDEYYDTLDKTMRRRFPEHFGDPEPEVKNRKAPSVVAPANRTTSSKRIRLKESQRSIAKKLGISEEQYAREVLKLEN